MTTTSLTAKETIARVQHAIRTKESASLPEVIKLIEELSGRALSISVQELSEIIGRDTMVTARVLQVANTFGYNPGGVPITTVTQAIQIVGFNKIRNLALSMMLLESATLGCRSEAQSESASMALCSGLVAQTLAESLDSQHEPEQAFVFACLRHYGRLLLSTFLAEEFKEVLTRPSGESEIDACRRIFGLSSLDLTLALFEAGGMPKSVLRFLQDLTHAQLCAATATAEEEMTAITAFSAALGEMLVSARLSPEEFIRDTEKLRAAFEKRVGIAKPAALTALMASVHQNLQSFARNYGARTVFANAIERVNARIAPNESKSSTATNTATPLAELPIENLTKPAEKPPQETADPTTILTECMLQLADISTSASPDFAQMKRAVLAALHNALNLSDCLFIESPHPGEIATARYGIGPLFKQLAGRPLLQPERRDLLTICFARKEDMLIRDMHDPKLKAYLPDWLAATGRIRSFLLLALHDERSTHGIIVCARDSDEPLQPKPRELQLIRALRQHLSMGKKLSRS